MIKQVFEEGRSTYGSRRIKKRLAQKKVAVSRNRITRLMKESSLVCKTKRKFKATTDSKHNKQVSPNLLARKFNVLQANSYWVGDITYVPTEEGWLYLATVIDLYSRKVVGWSMSNNMKAELVNKALLMAIWQRKPLEGLVWHTDRGSQYAADIHRAIIKQHHITQSMSRKGDCWDNAVAESFFSTLEFEMAPGQAWRFADDARLELSNFIDGYYNLRRLHSSNDYRSPSSTESNWRSEARAA